ncbi:hypothetical protein [Halorubrum sp. PV6]|uniref:hypothetical protein n=1 Tax=Halorubrum sp. PV6 TaxID=634157 RepID=UPI001198C05E|nr:hypothetical protein [Halorubrum sp. PV6]AZQ16070.1 hypothetical protein DOS48_14480 [Halorubrum sp. PV6]
MSVDPVLMVVVRPWPVCDHSEKHHWPFARRQSVAACALSPDTNGHEHHTAAGDLDDVEFPGMEDRLVEFWASADEYWDAVSGDPPRPH